jgi:uncharacterized protein (TIGR02145 family)
MKSTGVLKWSSPNTGDNSSGFLGYPGGQRFFNGTFYGAGDIGNWWSSMSINATYTLLWGMYYSNAFFGASPVSKKTGSSVRCVKD